MHPQFTSRQLSRFWSKVDKSGDCWLWTGGTTGVAGRGLFHVAMVDGKDVHEAAYRVSYCIAYGPIPPGMNVCHRCDVARCVRPDHLFLGTQADNLRDMNAKGRGRAAHGSQSGSARLTEEIVSQMRELHASGRTKRSIARELGFSHTTTIAAINRVYWKHVP